MTFTLSGVLIIVFLAVVCSILSYFVFIDPNPFVQNFYNDFYIKEFYNPLCRKGGSKFRIKFRQKTWWGRVEKYTYFKFTECGYGDCYDVVLQDEDREKAIKKYWDEIQHKNQYKASEKHFPTDGERKPCVDE